MSTSCGDSLESLRLPRSLSCNLKDEAPLPLLLGMEWHVPQSTSTVHQHLIEEVSRKIPFSPFFRSFCVFIVNEGFKSHLTSACPPAFTFLQVQLPWYAAAFVFLPHASFVTSTSPGRAAARLGAGTQECQTWEPALLRIARSLMSSPNVCRYKQGHRVHPCYF